MGARCQHCSEHCTRLLCGRTADELPEIVNLMSPMHIRQASSKLSQDSQVMHGDSRLRRE